MDDYFGQHGYAIRFDWGLAGARRCAADVNIIVDVLSFSTAVTVAADRGMAVYPFRWRDHRAVDFAADHGAVLAQSRSAAAAAPTAGGISLSPAGLAVCDPVARVVLPSPNGSTIAAALSAHGAVVAAGCLRNASAVGRWAAGHVEAGSTVAVIAAGERWRGDGLLRPAVEDQLGAGAIVAAMDSGVCSPEAQVAAGCFTASAGHLPGLLADSVSGRELADLGCASDVAVAADLDSCSSVPRLVDGAFRTGRLSGGRDHRRGFRG